jgi:CSLREA domain-containing protein
VGTEARHLAGGLGALVALMGGALALSASAFAATYAPNKTGDHTTNGCTHSDCTLREAITKANNHPGPDTIVLRGGKTYVLSLPRSMAGEDLNTSGDLDVLDGLTVTSSNRKRATVDANGIDRVFQIGPDAAVSATFRRIVIRDGDAPLALYGGGIDAERGGTLKLIRSKVVGNRAVYGGGIDAVEGSLRLIRSVVANNRAFDGYGGGIYDDRFGGPVNQYEKVSLSRSKIVDNSASLGVGGIESYNDTSITKSTIANNHAETQDGGGLTFGQGLLRVTSSTISGNTAALDYGGVFNQDNAIFVNDTITKNHAGGTAGGLFAGGVGETDLNAVTVARNRADTDGGGIYIDDAATLHAQNSLIGLNTDGSGLGPDCFADGSVVSGGHNLVANPGSFVCAQSFMEPGDITNVNPRIAQLANNGGPTKTIALRRHSKAINHAGSDAPTRDQRGVKRHDPDIGAFERR